MTRSPRRPSESGIYHVMSRGVAHCIIFEDDADRIRFLQMLDSVLTDFGAEVYAWCLMDNHFHILLKLECEKLSAAMKRIESAYALYFNKRHERDGYLFHGRFKSEPVESDEYFLVVLRYIHQNPVKAGITKTCDYPWSSYRAYAQLGGAVKPGLVSTGLALDMFGGVRGLSEFHSEVDFGAACCDIGKNRKLIGDDEALAVAIAVLRGVEPSTVAGLDRESRDAAIRKLRAANLSIRQIERLTGVSRGVVAKIR